MLVPVEDIKVKERIRKDMGDIAALAESMKRFGQLSPIIVTTNNVLIAGERRLEAARSLGWTNINVVIADISDEISMLEYELEENNQRRGFTQEEADAAAKKMYLLLHPSLFRRIINAIKGFFKRLFGKKKSTTQGE